MERWSNKQVVQERTHRTQAKRCLSLSLVQNWFSGILLLLTSFFSALTNHEFTKACFSSTLKHCFTEIQTFFKTHRSLSTGETGGQQVSQNNYFWLKPPPPTQVVQHLAHLKRRRWNNKSHCSPPPTTPSHPSVIPSDTLVLLPYTEKSPTPHPPLHSRSPTYLLQKSNWRGIELFCSPCSIYCWWLVGVWGKSIKREVEETGPHHQDRSLL